MSHDIYAPIKYDLKIKKKLVAPFAKLFEVLFITELLMGMVETD